MCPVTKTAVVSIWDSIHHIKVDEVIEGIQNPLTVTTYHQTFAQKCTDIFSKYFQVVLKEILYKKTMKQRGKYAMLSFDRVVNHIWLKTLELRKYKIQNSVERLHCKKMYEQLSSLK